MEELHNFPIKGTEDNCCNIQKDRLQFAQYYHNMNQERVTIILHTKWRTAGS